MFKKVRSCMVIAVGVVLMAMPQVALAEDLLVDSSEDSDTSSDVVEGEDRETVNFNVANTNPNEPSNSTDKVNSEASANNDSSGADNKPVNKPYGLSSKSGLTLGGDVITLHSPYLSGEVRKPIGRIKSYARGDRHELALLNNGSVVAWGDNDWGQLGYVSDDNSYINAQQAVIVKLPKAAIAITAKHNASVALLEDGTAYFWGDGNEPKPLPLDNYKVLDVNIVGEINDTSIVARICSDNSDCQAGADGVAVWSYLDRNPIIYTKEFDGRVREVAVNPITHDIAAITKDMPYTWSTSSVPRALLKNKYNLAPESYGFTHVSAGSLDPNGTSANAEQAFIVSDGAIAFAFNGGGVQGGLPLPPTRDPIGQLLDDGLAGHFALNEAGDVFVLYVGDNNSWINIATPLNEKIIRLIPMQPGLNEYTTGVVLGLSASGRLYELHTGNDAIPDITPDLTISTGKNKHLLKKIFFGGVELTTDKIEYLDDDTVQFSVPTSLHVGTVAVSIEDINGRKIAVGQYTYDKPQVPNNPNIFGSEEHHPSLNGEGKLEFKPVKPVNPIIKPFVPHGTLFKRKPETNSSNTTEVNNKNKENVENISSTTDTTSAASINNGTRRRSQPTILNKSSAKNNLRDIALRNELTQTKNELRQRDALNKQFESAIKKAWDKLNLLQKRNQALSERSPRSALPHYIDDAGVRAKYLRGKYGAPNTGAEL